jgi:hypothetical protein
VGLSWCTRTTSGGNKRRMKELKRGRYVTKHDVTPHIAHSWSRLPRYLPQRRYLSTISGRVTFTASALDKALIHDSVGAKRLVVNPVASLNYCQLICFSPMRTLSSLRTKTNSERQSSVGYYLLQEIGTSHRFGLEQTQAAGLDLKQNIIWVNSL